jgi:protein involved in polysaccharide export with SLBB domain
MVAPQVTVSLKTARVQRVIVLGAVAKSGPYDIKPGWRVSEALAAAGWTPGRADETVAKLARRGGQIVTVNLPAILSNPTSAHNKRLIAGDVLTLQALEPKRITVNGDVVKPDVYELHRARTLVDALNAAGGLKGRPSDTRGFILRKGKRIELNIDDATEFRTSSANVVLQTGDLINVELAPKRVTVNGDVAKPDQYELRRAPTLLDAINAAGGLKQEANEMRGFVLRGGKRIELDVEDAVQFRVAAANVKLQDGDLVSFEAIPRLRVTVSGPFARKPDNYELAPDAGVVQAVAQAGGPSVPYEQVVVTVQRGRQILR